MERVTETEKEPTRVPRKPKRIPTWEEARGCRRPRVPKWKRDVERAQKRKTNIKRGLSKVGEGCKKNAGEGDGAKKGQPE